MKRIIITTGVVAIAGGVATAAFVASCGPECEVDEKPSVIVQVIDEDAAQDKITHVTADEVWYEWTDEETGETVSKQATCMDDECTEWILGDGRPGTYEYHAMVCGRQYDSSVTLDLNDEGCEVDTQLIDLAVSTVDCPDVQAPEPPRPEPTSSEGARDYLPEGPTLCTLERRISVLVNVYAEIDGRMVPVPAERPYYKWDGAHDERKLPGVCLNEACSQFAAGFESEGTFRVGATVCGKVVRGEATVGKTPDGCHVETQTVVLQADASKCDPQLTQDLDVRAPNPPECSPMPYASAFVMPVTDGKDVMLPQPTEDLVYIHDDQRFEGYCAHEADNGKCLWWVTGFGTTGRFQAFTETCGVESAVTYTVEPGEDGCTPQTEYVPVFVDTRGCIRAPGPEGTRPPTTRAGADDITQ